MSRRSELYAVAEPCDRPWCTSGIWYHAAHQHKETVKLYGFEHPIVKVVVREIEPGETSIYWAWWSNEDQHFHWLWPSKGQVNMCFPYGPEVEEAKGRGHVLNVVVERG